MDSSYYIWRIEEGRLPGGGSGEIFNRDALGPLKPEIALAEVSLRLLSELHQVGRAILYGCGRGVLALSLARSSSALTIYDDNAVAAQAAGRTLAHAGIPARVECSICPAADQRVDLVILHPGPGRQRAAALMQQARDVLRAGGHLAIAAFNDAGASSYGKDAAARLGPPVAQVAMRHARAFLFRIEETPPSVPASQSYSAAGCPSSYSVEIGGLPLQVASRAGIFSGDHPDPGSMMLLEALASAPEYTSALDLGCGSGLLGAYLARRSPQSRVTMVDVSANAVACVAETVTLNKLTNAEILLGDAAEPLQERRFDLIVSNPPFHRGATTEYSTAREIIQAARRHALPTARFYLVANRFLRYEQEMSRWWPGFRIVKSSGGYKILMGQVA